MEEITKKARTHTANEGTTQREQRTRRKMWREESISRRLLNSFGLKIPIVYLIQGKGNRLSGKTENEMHPPHIFYLVVVAVVIVAAANAGAGRCCCCCRGEHMRFGVYLVFFVHFFHSPIYRFHILSRAWDVFSRSGTQSGFPLMKLYRTIWSRFSLNIANKKSILIYRRLAINSHSSSVLVVSDLSGADSHPLQILNCDWFRARPRGVCVNIFAKLRDASNKSENMSYGEERISVCLEQTSKMSSHQL